MVTSTNLNNKPVILYAFYRPPNFTPDVFQSLNNSPSKESSHIVMIGDFKSIPSVKWSSQDNVPVNTRRSPHNDAF